MLLNGATDTSKDTESFLQNDFCAQSYANAIIEGRNPVGSSIQTLLDSPGLVEINDSSARSTGEIKSHRTLRGTSPITARSPPLTRPSLSSVSPAIDSRHGPGLSAAGRGLGEGGVTLALSQLNISLDDIGRLIKERVTLNAGQLLNEAKHAIHVEEQLKALSERIEALHQSSKE